MSFICNNCSKSFCSKQSLKRHSYRKFKCIGVENNQNISRGDPKKIILAEKGDPKKIIVTLKKDQIENTNDYEELSPHKFSCEYCNLSFRHKTNKYRHLKKCVVKKELEKKIKIKELENKIVDLENKLKQIEPYNDSNNNLPSDNNNNSSHINGHNNGNNNYNVNNNGNQNINKQIINNNYNIQNHIQNNTLVNVTINGFGNENLDSISKKEIIEILNKRFEAFPAALEKIYTIPENQNFYLPNKRDKKYIKVFDGKKVSYEDSNDFVFNLSNKIMEQLENWFESHSKDIKIQRRKLMKNIFSIFNDGQLYDRYKKVIDKFLMTYSNSIKLVFENSIQNIRKQINIIENS